MADLLKAMRVLGDEARVRILRLLQQEELSVADLQEILGMGQSRISMQLSQLKLARFVEVRRAGAKSLYRYTPPVDGRKIIAEILRQSAHEITAAQHDDEALQLILRRRKDKLRNYFDELAGRFGRNYVPGRSWEALSEMLLRLLPPLVIADLGAGEGTLALLLAQSAKHVIAVDSSRKMVEFGADVAQRNGVANLEYRLGDLEDLPIPDGEADSGATPPKPAPCAASAEGSRRSLAHPQAGRQNCHYGSAEAWPGRSARALRGRMAGLLASGTAGSAAHGELSSNPPSPSCTARSARRILRRSWRLPEKPESLEGRAGASHAGPASTLFYAAGIAAAR